MTETWRAVPGFPGYEVSDQGHVRSVDRVTVDRLGRRARRRGVPLRPAVTAGGYRTVDLAGQTRPVHVLDTPRANNLDQLRDGTNHSRNRVRCPQDHLLAAPNLTAATDRRGCLACARARGAVQSAKRRETWLDFRTVADQKYAEIMGEELVA